MISLAKLDPLLNGLRTELKDFRERGHDLNCPRVQVRFATKSDATLIGLNADRETAYVGIYLLDLVRHKTQIPVSEAIEEIFLKYEGRPHWGKYRYLTSRRNYEKIYPGLQQFEAVRREMPPSRELDR